MKYVFEGLDGQDEITLRGVTFAKGKPVEVDDTHLAAKIASLGYFREVKTRGKANG